MMINKCVLLNDLVMIGNTRFLRPAFAKHRFFTMTNVVRQW